MFRVQLNLVQNIRVELVPSLKGGQHEKNTDFNNDDFLKCSDGKC